MSAPAFMAKIEENRAARLEVAEAMKREAGVGAHHVNERREDLSGLAFISIGDIRAPEGRRLVELATLAHECGHQFLHGAHDPEGYWLASHIKELEAEAYMVQAFEFHGLRMPKGRVEWGRTYVAEWIERDRAAGVPIDPGAEAYAKGTRSPFAPLRRVPATWHAAGLMGLADIRANAAPVVTVPAPAPRAGSLLGSVRALAARAATWLPSALGPKSVARVKIERPWAFRLSREAVFFSVLQPLGFGLVAHDYARNSHAFAEGAALQFGLSLGLIVGLLGGAYIAWRDAHTQADIDSAWAWFKLTALPRAVFLLALLMPTIADA